MHIMLDMHMHRMHFMHMKLDTYLSENNITEEAFAAKVSVTQPQVNKWRNGVSRPSWGSMDAIHLATGGKVGPADWISSHKPAQSEQAAHPSEAVQQ